MPINIFGVPLDATDSPERVELKRAYIAATASGRVNTPDYGDPYEALSTIHGDMFAGAFCDMLGNIPVEGFLLPKPGIDDAGQVTATDYGAFLHAGGFLEYARCAGEFIEREVLPEPFLMLGVDHSTTGGALEALSAEHGGLALIVLDAHYDGIGPRVMSGFSEFCMEMSPELAGEMGVTAGVDAATAPVPANSYTCGDFLARAFEEGWAEPGHSMVLGVADYPRQAIRSSDDPRAREYVEAYDRFTEDGLTIVSRDELKRDPADVLRRLSGAPDGSSVYFSVDMDVACDPQGVYGTRFASLPGLDSFTLNAIVERLTNLSDEYGSPVVGADIMELDVHLAGRNAPGTPPDRTYDVAGLFIVAMLRMLSPHALK